MTGITPAEVALGPPARWLKCPRKGQVVGGRFVPFKTPLCELYNDVVPEVSRFYPSMLFSSFGGAQGKIGLWIDLTNTCRFYDQKDVQNAGAKYVKLKCRGHGECPSKEQTTAFIKLCQKFIHDNPDKLVAVHCTHGFNRTGFLIASYLVLVESWSTEAAVAEFAKVRPPGIYKQDYLVELFKRFDDADATPAAPPLPSWCNEPDYPDEEESANGSRNSGAAKKAAAFVEGIPSVTVVADRFKLLKLQKMCQRMCGFRSHGFPGGQPVSMDMQNILLLESNDYMVSWKADGVRYMILIAGENNVYMIDRDNNYFFVPDLRFPHRKESRHIKDTLLDGELIFDESMGKTIPSFLVYDIIVYEGQPVGQCQFDRRELCIQKEIIGPRREAFLKGTMDRSKEPFQVRIKQFWDITHVSTLLSGKFTNTLTHKIDGVIFQPYKEPYTAGRWRSLLKWKPHNMNTVDFKLCITREKREGMLPEWKAYLYVLGLDVPFGSMKVTKELMNYDKKIIECYFENSEWKMLRQRTDKSFPNAYETAMSICASIQNPVTKEFLIDFVKQRAKKPRALPKADTA